MNLKGKKVYIAGPMTGLPNNNKDQFNLVAKSLAEAEGAIVLNPAILPAGLSQADYMRICLAMVQTAEVIVRLIGWHDSKGAIAEVSLGEKLELDMLDQILKATGE